MEKEGNIKFEMFTWKKISHGLFDYDNKNCNLTNLKVDQDSQVFVRAGDSIKAFPSFELAGKFKTQEMRGSTQRNDKEFCTFLF